MAGRSGQSASKATPNISVITGDITSPTSTVSTAQVVIRRERGERGDLRR